MKHVQFSVGLFLNFSDPTGPTQVIFKYTSIICMCKRLREPEKADGRGISWRRSYHFTGHTQYQALQASYQYNHPEGEAGHVNRATGGRFTDRLRSVDMGITNIRTIIN